MTQQRKQDIRGSGGQLKPSPGININQPDQIYKKTLNGKAAGTDPRKYEVFESRLNETMKQHQNDNEKVME